MHKQRDITAIMGSLMMLFAGCIGDRTYDYDGIVVDSATHQPVSDVKINSDTTRITTLYSPDTPVIPYLQTTDSNGRFHWMEINKPVPLLYFFKTGYRITTGASPVDTIFLSKEK